MDSIGFVGYDDPLFHPARSRRCILPDHLALAIGSIGSHTLMTTATQVAVAQPDGDFIDNFQLNSQFSEDDYPLNAFLEDVFLFVLLIKIAVI